MGPLVIDLVGLTVSETEKRYLSHPLVGGVILFARNYQSSKQLKQLAYSIKSIRDDVFIAVDHEGGRVQRFRQEFTQLPAMGNIHSNEQAYACGVIMAYELRQHGIDVNFAPVLDRDNGSRVIGDRGFAAQPEQVFARASALIEGLHAMQYMSCGKHFPGHGSVEADSHIACPVDKRQYLEIETDMQPFLQLIQQHKLDAIMPAHVVYSACDGKPAGYSEYWLQQKLRTEAGFEGVIFSDDLSMQGATVVGDHAKRAQAAYQAGCDFLLLCNAPEQTSNVLSSLEKVKLRPHNHSKRMFMPLPKDAEVQYRAALAELGL